MALLVVPSKMCSAAIDWNNPHLGTNSATDLLKEFIASPPASGRMLYSRRQTLQLPDSKPSDKTNFFVMMWRSPDFFLAEVRSNRMVASADPANLVDTGGVFESKPWYQGLGILNMMEGDAQQKASLDLEQNRHYYESRFLAAKNFGLMHRPQTLEWDGLHFHGKTYGGTELKGKLIVGEAGLPTRIEVESEGRKGRQTIIHELVYSSASEGIRLPSLVKTSCLLENGVLEPNNETCYLSIEFQNTQLSADDFNPRTIFSKPHITKIISNNESYYVKDGKKVDGQPVTSVSKSPKMVLVALSVISVAALFIFIKKGVRQG